jgi:glycosyltransferase involved in cell wall biosynthesis
MKCWVSVSLYLTTTMGGFLAEAIDSALNQDHPVCEVIVVDDGSTDNSRAVIARYGDKGLPFPSIRSIIGKRREKRTAYA